MEKHRVGLLLALLAVAHSSRDMVSARVPVSTSSIDIVVLSNRADLISGGDALVEIVLPAHTDRSVVRVDVDGRDVTTAFDDGVGGRFYGLVTGLRMGANVLTAQLPDGSGARITITNHSSAGPIFSGPHVQPWICTTEENGLGASDAECSAPPIIDYLYKPARPRPGETEFSFRHYDPTVKDEDIARTTTDHGLTVPFVVRREAGTINRALYYIVVLADPTKPWSANAPQARWNRKLFYAFGNGAGDQHNQGTFRGLFGLDEIVFNTDSDPRDYPQSIRAMGLGFVVASATVNHPAHSLNTVTSAETIMMLKERVAEQYGPIRYTLGEGTSGGSILALAAANGYPGLIDALSLETGFPDVWTTIFDPVDCALLVRYFTATSPHLWADVNDQTAVSGKAPEMTSLPNSGVAACAAWTTTMRLLLDPASGCGLAKGPAGPLTGVPTGADYHPVLNPQGCRATPQDLQVGVWGRRESDGFAKWPVDNVGVQYGLEALTSDPLRALTSETITVDQFLDLNQKIGGLDIDGGFTTPYPNADPDAPTPRSIADPDTPWIAHRSAQVNDMRRLDAVPVIHRASQLSAEIHETYQAFRLRARLEKAVGHSGSYVIWQSERNLVNRWAEIFTTLDSWLAAIEADTSADPLLVKVLRNRPEFAVDACWFTDPDSGAEVRSTDPATCDARFMSFGNARTAAGAPLASDVIKCELKPLNRGEYNVEFNDEQWARLLKIFPDGVCDWTTKGVGQLPSRPWTSFADGPGGRPLGPAPRAEHF